MSQLLQRSRFTLQLALLILPSSVPACHTIIWFRRKSCIPMISSFWSLASWPAGIYSSTCCSASKEIYLPAQEHYPSSGMRTRCPQRLLGLNSHNGAAFMASNCLWLSHEILIKYKSKQGGSYISTLLASQSSWSAPARLPKISSTSDQVYILIDQFL